MATSSLAYDLSRFEAHPVEEKPQPQIRKVAKTAQKTSARVNPLKAVITMVLVIGVTFALL